MAALVAKYYGAEKLETYSIGLLGSEDLKYANIVAQYLGTKHTSLTLTEDEFFEAIPEVIKNNSKAKVIFNGDG